MSGSSISAWVKVRICGRERSRGIGRMERARVGGDKNLRGSIVAKAGNSYLLDLKAIYNGVSRHRRKMYGILGMPIQLHKLFVRGQWLGTYLP